MQLVLVRDTYLLTCTLGVLHIDGVWYQTIEPPWIQSTSCRGGTPLVSCVAEGTYKMVRHDSVRHPLTWALVNDELDVCANPTPGKRDDVLIHPANWASELEGCIAPGLIRSFVDNRWMVVNSQKAFANIKAQVPYTDEHTIVIEHAK